MRIQDEYTMYDRNQACCVCNVGARRVEDRLVNLDAYIDMEGLLVICESCVDELIHLLGKDTKEKFDKIAAELTTARELNLTLQAKLDEAKQVFA